MLRTCAQFYSLYHLHFCHWFWIHNGLSIYSNNIRTMCACTHNFVHLLMHFSQSLWQQKAGYSLLSLGGACGMPEIHCPSSRNTALPSAMDLPRLHWSGIKLWNTCSTLMVSLWGAIKQKFLKRGRKLSKSFWKPLVFTGSQRQCLAPWTPTVGTKWWAELLFYIKLAHLLYPSFLWNCVVLTGKEHLAWPICKPYI